MGRRQVLIIGGGPAGLAAGIYCGMAGLEPLVLEGHRAAGGLCTSWKRKGYTIDGCVHFIMGSGPGSVFHEMWKELGVFEKLDPIGGFHYFDDFFHFRFADGQQLRLSTDLTELERSLRRVSPADAPRIRTFTRAVRDLSGFSPPLDLLEGWRSIARAGWRSLPFAVPLIRWQNTSIDAFAGGFRSHRLREMFRRLWYPDYSMLYILLILGWLGKRLAGYPKVNSLGFSTVLEQGLLERGGEIRYGARVRRILRTGGRAVGVRLESGEEISGDYVIAAACAPETLSELLGDQAPRPPGIPITPPLVHVVFGSSYEFSGYRSAACGMQLEISPPIEMSGEDRDFLLIHVYDFAEDLAPPGRVLVKIMYPTHYSRWARLGAAGKAGYTAAKEQAAAACIEAMERYFPGFGDSVDMTDVATPVTFHRYTENQLGSLIAWGAVAGAPLMLKKTIPGVDRLVLAGHWRMPGGGVPQAALSGRHAVQWICCREGIATDWPASRRGLFQRP